MIRQAEKLTEKLLEDLESKPPEHNYTIALSGGNSPSVLFRLWREKYLQIIPWGRISFFWVDERCVPPDHPLSNYGRAKRELLDFLPVEPHGIYRIKGEEDPHEEATHYSQLVLSNLQVTLERLKIRSKDSKFKEQLIEVPLFDFVLLGIGDDGHTSSIFPGNIQLLYSPDPYGVGKNPYTGQCRVAITGYPLQFASLVAFFAEGESKSEIVDTVVRNANNLIIPETDPRIIALPAANILRRSKNSHIYYAL